MRLIDADKLCLEVADKYWDKVILEGVREYNPYAIRNEIIELIGEQPSKQQWNMLRFRPLNLEEKEFDPDCVGCVADLPDFGEEVLVTDGTSVWVDSFDKDDDGVWLSGTDNIIGGVIAWMEIPSYKENQ